MHWKATCAYDGTDLAGWQSQSGGNTVQDLIEARLAQIFVKNIRIHGSGRTDAGVHAKGQVFHFDADWSHPPHDLLNALRLGLTKNLHIVSLQKVSKDFHARFSVIGKCYAYTIYQGYALPTESRYCWSLGPCKLDIAAMKAAASHLIGKHDFSAFSATAKGDSGSDPSKEIRRLDIIKKGNHIRIVTEGTGYLYKMVRSIVGALVDVGLGKLTPGDFQAILISRRRTHKVVTAPAKGLFLERVLY